MELSSLVKNFSLTHLSLVNSKKDILLDIPRELILPGFRLRNLSIILFNPNPSRCLLLLLLCLVFNESGEGVARLETSDWINSLCALSVIGVCSSPFGFKTENWRNHMWTNFIFITLCLPRLLPRRPSSSPRPAPLHNQWSPLPTWTTRLSITWTRPDSFDN